MRHFSAYGPLNPKQDFHINRRTSVEKVAQQLVGDPDTGGHFFTIFAPRQAGKTTTLREAAALIRERYGERFDVGIAILHLVDDLRVWFPSVILAVDRAARQTLPMMFGPHGWDILQHPERLPELLTTVCGRMTGGG